MMCDEYDDDIDGGNNDGNNSGDYEHDDGDDDNLGDPLSFAVTKGRCAKGCCAEASFSRPLFAPQASTKLAPAFKVIGPTSVFAFSRSTGFAVWLHRFSSGCFFSGFGAVFSVPCHVLFIDKVSMNPLKHLNPKPSTLNPTLIQITCAFKASCHIKTIMPRSPKWFLRVEVSPKRQPSEGTLL